MTQKRIKKKTKNNVTRFIKKNIKFKPPQILLIGLVIGSFYFYNEVYLNTIASATPIDQAYQKVTCVDGDTFKLDDQTIRLLAIDTPETVKPNYPEEPFGKEASTFTCNKLIQADNITLKVDKGNEIDKYERMLAWVYVDDELLQESLVRGGYAEIKYVHQSSVDRSLLTKLKSAEKSAKQERLRIWENQD